MNFKLVVFIFLVICISACTSIKEELMLFQGKTMGTEYHVRMYDDRSSKTVQTDLKNEIDSILVAVNKAISGYEPHSLVSYFNKSTSNTVRFPEGDTTNGLLVHFFKNLEVGYQTYQASDGYFDPTVMKLVNYWGFGYSGRTKIDQPDSTQINRLIQSTGMDKVQFTFDEKSKNYTLSKKDSTMELDFGGIGQGYGADIIAEFLSQKGYTNFLVELGGELVAKGLKPDGSKWSVGLNTPLENASKDEVFSRVLFTDKALTTSGNYRNFYKSGDQTFSHTMNPKTGYPERSTLLSVSLIGDKCTDIDAMATACMAVGIVKCKQIIIGKNMEAYFVFREGEKLLTDMTSGFSSYLAK